MSEAEREVAVLCRHGLPTFFRSCLLPNSVICAVESKAKNVILSQISVLHNESKTYLHNEKEFSAFWRGSELVWVTSWRNTQLKSSEWSLPQLQVLCKPVTAGSQPRALFVQVYLCSCCGVSVLVRLWFSSLLLHENLVCRAALNGSVVGNRN